jgi:hypothetical protein
MKVKTLKTLSSPRSSGRQVSLVIPSLSYINMHLINVFTFLLALILMGSYKGLCLVSFDHCLVIGLIN